MKSIRFNIIKLALLLTLGITKISYSMDWNRGNPVYVDPLRLKLSTNSVTPPYLNNDGTTVDPSIQILEYIPEGERYGVCHNYAISKTIGLLGKIPETFSIQGCDDWYTDFNFLNDYCEKITQPQKGDFVIYKSSISDQILHTGLVYDYDKDLVESKWGIRKHVLIHSTFSVPLGYGDRIEYYRPIKSNNEIIKDIHRKIDDLRHFSYINPNYHPIMINTKERDTDKKNWILGTMDKKMDCVVTTSDGKLYDQRCINTEEYIDRCMDFDINISLNQDDETPIIFTAKHDSFDLAKLLITYKANINHQDKNGNTALIVAAKQNHLKTRLLLLEQKNCNKKLRDNEGNKASDYTFQQYPLLLSLKRAAKGIKDFGLL
jgi:hypothetical protein